MPFVLLLLLALACLPTAWPQPGAILFLDQPGNPLWYAGLTWAGVLMLLLAAARLAHRTSTRLAQSSEQRDLILIDYARGRARHLAASYLFFPSAVYALGWGWTVQTCCAIPSPFDGTSPPQAVLFPAGELLVIAPLLVTLIGSWVFFYDADRLLVATSRHADPLTPPWTRWTYLVQQMRQNLALVAAPVLVLIFDKSLRRFVPAQVLGWGVELFLLALLGGVFVCLPWILRFSLGLRPLPAGPLRERLLSAARRLNFRVSDILVWDTHGGVANAMVAGILPQLRYVLLTDRLIAELSPDEVEAVFGHEVGHVRHHHMFYYLGFLMLSLTAVAGLWDAATRHAPAALQLFLQTHGDLQVLPLVAIVCAYIFVVFGFLSRRCERQADIFGCRAVSCSLEACADHTPDTPLSPQGKHLCPTGIRTFINALEKVALLNGISRSRPGWLQSWQHSTIARRVEFLQRLLADPSLEPRFQRTVGLVKWSLFLALSAILLALGATQGWDSLRPI
jgi:Zn-dependent protease with chaperone function